MSLRESIKRAKQLRLSWRGVLAVMGATLLIGLLLLYFGKFELASPIIFSLITIAFAIAVKWELRRRVWFWIAMIVIAALHVPLVLFVPWTTRWVPAILITPILVADLFAMLGILSVVEKFVERRRASEG